MSPSAPPPPRHTLTHNISRVIKDLFISSIQLSWGWTMFNLFAAYFISWFLFAVVWYLIGLLHGHYIGSPFKII